MASNYDDDRPQRGSSGYRIPNHLVMAIISLLCCCPLGIPAVVFAAKVNGLEAQGDVAGAEAASNKAKMFAMIGLIIGIPAQIIGIIAQVYLQTQAGKF